VKNTVVKFTIIHILELQINVIKLANFYERQLTICAIQFRDFTKNIHFRNLKKLELKKNWNSPQFGGRRR